jgi:hypothetical protein
MIVDGNTLKRYFIKQAPPLCRLKFNIYSMVKVNYLPHLQSIQEIQKTFENYENKIISSVHHFSKMNSFYCHVYSYPFTWTSYHYITNNFPGGLFRSVREISLHDEHPFEYDFFSRIAQSFPFVQKITLRNIEGQKNNHVQSSHILSFVHLIKIDLVNAHEDYLEEFLNHTKICLLNNVYLRANYDSLEKVTNNFTRDETRMNCSKIIRLTSSKRMTNIDENFQKYFPVAEISS